MRHLIIVLSLIIISPILPDTGKAEAQVERRIARRQTKRKVRRTTRRRVRRRVARHAHFKYKHLPRYRVQLATAPASAIVVKRNGIVYHYHEGLYYKPSATAFVVVRPDPGVRVRTLPAARRKIIISNNNYYYYYGTFYKLTDNVFEVVEAPKGALVDALPDGYEVAEIDGTEYYELDGDYYQEVETDEIEGGIGYEVVKI